MFWPPSAVSPTLAGFHNVVALMHVDGNSPRSPQAPGVCPAPHPAPSSAGPALWSDAERATDQERALCPPGPSSPRPAPAPAARCPAAPTHAAALAVCTLFMLQRILHLPSVLTCPSDHVYAPLHHSRRAFLFRECVTTAHSTLDSRVVRFLGIDAQGMNSSFVRTSRDTNFSTHCPLHTCPREWGLAWVCPATSGVESGSRDACEKFREVLLPRGPVQKPSGPVHLVKHSDSTCVVCGLFRLACRLQGLGGVSGWGCAQGRDKWDTQGPGSRYMALSVSVTASCLRLQTVGTHAHSLRARARVCRGSRWRPFSLPLGAAGIRGREPLAGAGEPSGPGRGPRSWVQASSTWVRCRGRLCCRPLALLPLALAGLSLPATAQALWEEGLEVRVGTAVLSPALQCPG